jgi:hypothetical protein
MSELLSLSVLARYAHPTGAERLAFYLEEDCRPDFQDEVPEYEASWVDAFEFLPTAKLERLDDHTLVAHFSSDSGFGDELEDILNAIALTGPKAIYFYAFLGDNEWYASYHNGHKKLIWAVAGLDDPDDEKGLNQRLNKEEQERLKSVGTPSMALAELARMEV